MIITYGEKAMTVIQPKKQCRFLLVKPLPSIKSILTTQHVIAGDEVMIRRTIRKNLPSDESVVVE